MKKLQIKKPVILPQVPNEKDTCVERLIKELEAKDGTYLKKTVLLGIIS